MEADALFFVRGCGGIAGWRQRLTLLSLDVMASSLCGSGSTLCLLADAVEALFIGGGTSDTYIIGEEYVSCFVFSWPQW